MKTVNVTQAVKDNEDLRRIFEALALQKNDMDSRVKRLVAMADAMGLTVTNRPK